MIPVIQPHEGKHYMALRMALSNAFMVYQRCLPSWDQQNPGHDLKKTGLKTKKQKLKIPKTMQCLRIFSNIALKLWGNLPSIMYTLLKPSSREERFSQQENPPELPAKQR